MIQAPIQNYGMYGNPQMMPYYGMQQPVQQHKQCPAYGPSYNAVQINMDTPTVNAPPAMPYYPPMNMQYPMNPYMMPQPQMEQAYPMFTQPQFMPQPQMAPVVPLYPTQAPCMPIPQNIQQTQAQPQIAPVVPLYPGQQDIQQVQAQPQTRAAISAVPVPPVVVPPQVMVQPPQNLPVANIPAANVPPVQVVPATENNTDEMVNKAFTGLNSSDYDTQALALEEIAKKGLENSEDAIPYLQEHIFDKLIDIMNTDTSKLAGPTDRQVEIRDKMAQNDRAIEDAVNSGKDPKSAKLPFKLTAQEEDEANTLSPYEQAERNKEYALFTTAILQKTYADELKKQTGTVPPVTELPGSRAVITVLKTSDEPNMAVAAIDALRYVQRPEYKDDLTTLYSIAQNDSREEVSQAAGEALKSLDEM